MSTTDDGPSSVLGPQYSKTNCVNGDWEISLVLSEQRAMPLRANFTYRADDPYATRLEFHLDRCDSVRWTFARELLTMGTVRPAGHADVRLRPTGDGAGVSLALKSRQGEALFRIPLVPLNEWLERTYQLVPPGAEHRFLGLDTRLKRLLQETPYGFGSAN